MMLRDTPDKIIQDVKPELKTGKKWTPSKAITEAESNLRFKEICGAQHKLEEQDFVKVTPIGSPNNLQLVHARW